MALSNRRRRKRFHSNNLVYDSIAINTNLPLFVLYSFKALFHYFLSHRLEDAPSPNLSWPDLFDWVKSSIRTRYLNCNLFLSKKIAKRLPIIPHKSPPISSLLFRSNFRRGKHSFHFSQFFKVGYLLSLSYISR